MIVSFNKVSAVITHHHKHWLVRIALCAVMGGLIIGLSACESTDDVASPTEVKKSDGPGVDIKSLQAVTGETLYDVNEINGQVPPKAGPISINAQLTPKLSIRGWAVDKQAQNDAGGVFINIDGKTDIQTNRQDRPDVSEAYKNSHYNQSGFQASIPLAPLAKGRHTISLKIVTADQKGYYEPKQRFEVEIQ